MMLDRILESTRRRLPRLVQQRDDLYRQAMETPPPPSFRSSLAEDDLAVIAEVKRRSPSRGDLAPDLDPADQAGRYLAGGARAISVLTEPEFFSGSPNDLMTVARRTGLPVLRKDFILDAAQIWEARIWGASAVLLIVAALDDAQLVDLMEAAEEVGLDALVEVHDVDEAQRAVASGAEIIGVNNRDLTDFTVDLATAERVAPVIADVPVTIAESGIFVGSDARRMADAGYDAVLVGEALVRAEDPTALLHELRGVG